ncbi:phenylalanine--tRNA ligase subunit beta [Kiloniella laminariae]|uniref:Phenylalanine--tRNA ligase beta subunit n=1 Tax=Kiloniella laminariae TaxID=454162 RepID=A0ABT4LKF5_9PROT|nr:phenylalanine--tRNA ligase subunit beta [Kiloniella laminariae]MCZ4281564.1 phenylalanine--tRNA ligase subunit beta [Kiloniella laminariae]
MKFTLNWLKDHLDTDASLEVIVEKLSLIGLEVEGVENKAEELKAFKTARVVEAIQHPNADRLRVCQVQTAEGTSQVVCGAPNARTGMVGVFAPVGSYVPGIDLLLKPGKLRGEESNGMLVSEREMGLSDEHDGIIDLPDDTEIGVPLAEILGLDDPIIEIAITPNRGDCLGVRGVARDLAAAGLGKLKPLQTEKHAGTFTSPISWKIDAEVADKVPYVAGRYFKGLKNGPSPKWMQDRLRAIGNRPISALVDITNYVSFDLGRPLHVFDADKLSGDLTMRNGRDGEEFLALDEETYQLADGMVVIGDDAAVQGIGGVMGGMNSGCGDTTSNMFLEVALFDPVSVAVTGRKTGINSDARYRFERSVDPVSADWGVDVATRMVLDLCGGEVSNLTSAGEIPSAKRLIELRPERVAQLCGVAIAQEKQIEILTKLGFEVAEKGAVLSVAVPSWRSDVEMEACLVEEVLRIHGYENIPELEMSRDHYLPQGVLTLAQRRVSNARTALCWRGLDEAVTFSFVSRAQADLFGSVPDCLRVANPISTDLDTMRPSILPTLLAAAAKNTDRGYGDNALFEVGPQYQDDTAKGQLEMASGLRSGKAAERHWENTPRPVDLFDAKGDALAALSAAGAPVDNLQVFTTAPAYYHPGRSGALGLGPTNVLAYFGELHPRVLEAMDIKGPVVAFEVFLEKIPQPKVKKGESSNIKPALVLSAFQPVERDFAFLVDDTVEAGRLLRAVVGADKNLISNAVLFDIYTGKGVEEGKKSLAVTVTLQPKERTLTDEEIDAVSQKVLAQAMKATGAVLRS